MKGKAALRAEARDRLLEMAPGEQVTRGARIAELVWTVPGLADSGSLLVYASRPGEVPTDGIADRARSLGISVIYPRCPPGSSDLTLHLVRAAHELGPGGRFGIREPGLGCPEVRLGSVDAVLLPGLGWDRRGHRLGRGAGYYDRLLGDPNWSGLRVGLFFAIQELDRIPEDPWDVPLDAVVTENEVVRF